MNFFGLSFHMGRMFDIDIRIHITFFLFLLFRMSGGGDPWWSLGFSAMLFGIILLHEFGHCFGARAVGGDARQIILWPLGGLAFAHAPMTPWAQFVTVAAGPAVNLVFVILAGAVLAIGAGTPQILGFNPLGIMVHWQFWPGAPEWASYVALFYAVNLWLLAFNLLPVYPLDGGQLFQIALWPSLGVHRSTEIACQVGVASSVVMGVYSLQGGGGMLLFIAIFAGFASWQRLQALKYGMVIDERVPVQRYNVRTKSMWERIFGSRSKVKEDEDLSADNNPNPGGWESRLKEKEDRESEVDRILKKVSEHGIGSLSYVEQQTLQKASEERKRRSG